MKHLLVILCALLFTAQPVRSQTTANPSPYCSGNFSNGSCLQGGPPNTPGNSLNDFIDDFSTTGGITNITNNSSGCNGNPNNYVNNYCKHYLVTAPGQTITCKLKSGTIYAQGFAIFIDWNQDNIFQTPGEQVAATPNVPAAAAVTTLSFVIPALQPNGTYRLRVRCAYVTTGTAITPCGTLSHGETEDYGLFIGPIPVNSGIITTTLSGNPPICSGQNLNLSVSSTPSTGITYSWTGPGGFANVSQNIQIPNATPAASGIYTMSIGGACPVSKTIAATVVAYPVYTLIPNNPVICQYDSVTVSPLFSAGTATSAYTYTWSASPGISLSSASTYSTTLRTISHSATQYFITYSVTVTSTVLSCPVTKAMTLTVNNPSSPTLSMPPPVCNTFSPVLISASPGGGTWTAGPAVSASGSFSPGLAAIGTNTLTYSVTLSGCVVGTDGTVSVSQFNTPALKLNPGTLCANDPAFDLMSLVQTTVGGTWSGQAVSNNTFLTGGLPTGNYALTYSTQSTPIASVCPAFSIYSIPVYNPPVPTISAIKPVCNTWPTATLSASIPGGLWLGTGISSSGIQFPSLNLIGTNSVTYAVGQGTCLATVTKTFHVSQFNTAALTTTFLSTCVNQGSINLMAQVQNTVAGSWYGPFVTGTYSFGIPTNLPSFIYTLTYINRSTPDPYLCPDTSTFKLSVYSPPIAHIQQVGPFCTNHSAVQLSVTPNTGTWTASSYLNSVGVLTPSLCGPGYNLVQYITGTNTCTTKQSILVHVESFVPAKITGSVADQCNTNSVVDLSRITLSNLGTWSGPGVSGTAFNPGLAGKGSFILKYNTASSPSALCPDRDSLSVNVFSLAVPVLSKAGPFCNLATPSQLTVSPVGGIFGGDGICIDSKGLFNPALSQIGNNIITYSISSGPCVAYAQTTITVEKFVSAGLAKQLMPFCRTSEPVNMNSFVQHPGGDWSGPGISGNMFHPSLANAGTNVVVYKTYSIPTKTLCPDNNTIQISVKDPVPVTANANRYKGCAPMEVMFRTPSVNFGKGTWYFDDGSEPATGLTPDHVFLNPGIYTVHFRHEDGICPEEKAEPLVITVDEAPLADFYVPEEILASAPEVQLHNLSAELLHNKYTWKIADLYTLNEINPSVRLEKAGTYLITLTATTANGCRHETTKYIRVKDDLSVYIPDAFSPNFDGLNDVFIPVSSRELDPKAYQLEIFDRWGHSLFYSKNPAAGWDGRSAGSDEIAEGVYTYRLSFREPDGNTYTKTGHVSLIR